MAKTLEEFPEEFHAEVYRKDAEALGKQVAEYVDKGYVESLRKSDISVRRAFEQRYSAIKYQLEFGVITQETYFDKLTALRDRYFAKDTQEWYKYTAEIYGYKVDMLAEYEKAVVEHEKELQKSFANISKDAERTIDGVTKRRDAYASSVENAFGSGVGYDTRETKIHNYYPTGDTLYLTDYSLSDLDKEIDAMLAYDAALMQLIERADNLDAKGIGVFLENLKNISVEDASRLANLLLSGDDRTFIDYMAALQERKELSGKIADTLYASEYEKISQQVKAEVAQTFDSIPEDFFTMGEVVAENFTEGFHAKIADLFTGLEWIFLPATEKHATQAPAGRSFSPVYHLYGSGETVAEQLISARNAALLDALRTNLN